MIDHISAAIGIVFVRLRAAIGIGCPRQQNVLAGFVRFPFKLPEPPRILLRNAVQINRLPRRAVVRAQFNLCDFTR